MKYAIFYGGREITPPDNVKQIFHGAKLIWERAAAALLADTTLRDYRFTRGGLLCPGYVSADDTAAKFYDSTGKNILFSSSFASCFADRESGRLLWSESPMYVTQSISGSGVAQVAHDIPDFVVRGDSGDFEYHWFEPILSDTAEQWKGHSITIAKHLASFPNALADGGGAGITPLRMPIGYTDGQPSGVSNRQTLAYMRNSDEILVTDKDYSVLSVCGDVMVCGDKPYTKNTASAYGRITERTLTGEVIRTHFASAQRLVTYDTKELRRRFYIAGDYLIYNSTHSNALYLAAKPRDKEAEAYDQDGYNNSILGQNLPENVFYYGGQYYIVDTTITHGATPEDAGKPLYLPGDDFGGYVVYNPRRPGSYWLDEANGVLYVMAVSKETDKNGNNDYRVIQIQL